MHFADDMYSQATPWSSFHLSNNHVQKSETEEITTNPSRRLDSRVGENSS